MGLQRCFIFSFIALVLFWLDGCYGENPIITYRYSADPSAHVWPGSDRVWVYASHDQPNAKWFDTMKDWALYSSNDMVTWKDHGIIYSLKNTSWAKSHAWAPDAAYYKGKYYFIFPARDQGGKFRTGLAIGNTPAGPFKDIGYVKDIDNGKDPALFIDDDGQPYLFWGPDNQIWGAKLTSDLKAIVPGTKKYFKDLNGFEAPWMHKYNGKYYISYGVKVGSGSKEGLELHYATANSPLGPFSKPKKFMDRTGCWTNHASITKFKGKWYLFYHTFWLSGGNPFRRSVNVENLSYDKDGGIKMIKPTKSGVSKV